MNQTIAQRKALRAFLREHTMTPQREFKHWVNTLCEVLVTLFVIGGLVIPMALWMGWV